eukprot:TRINITY_DN4128_c0_g1_i1.p1 TRINITY_DN4128_c0_g1~~TRINITY_DN4128_c0_g1_i1.p1  ORF type:complete len:560 (+),score=89.40 TRINITY_DN4128_c0_g1_i1:71-1750(+)
MVASRLVILCAAGVLSCSADAVVQQKGNVGAQLATYEGKRTSCWITAVSRLKEGCQGESVLSEDERTQVAVDFANCQFQDDNLPTYATSQEMADEVRKGNHLAYSIFTHHLLNAETICMNLAQLLFQQSTKEVTSDLLHAGREVNKRLSDMATETSQLRDRVQHNVESMERNVERTIEEGKRTREQILEEQRSFGQRMKVLAETTEGAQERLDRLSKQSENVSNNLVKVELSSKILDLRQSEMQDHLKRLGDIERGIFASVFDNSTFLTVCSVSTVLYLFVVCPYLRAPLLMLLIAAFAAERLIVTAFDSLIGELEAQLLAGAGAGQEEILGLTRRFFASAALVTIFWCWLRHRTPEEVMGGRVDSIERKLDRLLQAATNVPMMAVRVQRRGASVEPRTSALPAVPTPAPPAAASITDARRGRSVTPAPTPCPPVTAPPATAARPAPPAAPSAAVGGSGGGGCFSAFWAPMSCDLPSQDAENDDEPSEQEEQKHVADEDEAYEPEIRRDSEPSEGSVSSPSTSSTGSASSSSCSSRNSSRSSRNSCSAASSVSSYSDSR